MHRRRRRPAARARTSLHRGFADTWAVLLPALAMLAGALITRDAAAGLRAATARRQIAASTLGELRQRVGEVDRLLAVGDVARADAAETALRRWLRRARGRLPATLDLRLERGERAMWLRIAPGDDVEDGR